MLGRPPTAPRPRAALQPPVLPLLAGLALLVAGCRPEPPAGIDDAAASRGPLAAAPTAASPPEGNGGDEHAAPGGDPVPVRLTDVAAAVGVRFQHEFGGQHPLPIVETMGSGAAFMDYDDDGRPDLFLVSSGQDFRRDRQRPGCRLFHNEGDGRFTDVTAKSGIAIDAYAMGCCAGDYDNDGHVDLFVTGFGRNTLLHNEAGPYGGRRFRDVTRTAGLLHRPGQWGTGCAFADLDGDGWLDLYVANYVRYNPSIPLCPTARVMSGCTPGHYVTQPNELYLNKRDGTFGERAKAAGVDDPGGAGLGVVAADFDNDGRPDLFVANDGTPNALLHNLGGSGGELRFGNIGLSAGVAYGESGTMRAGMGTDAGDFDGDGRLDLVITNFQHEPTSLYRNVSARFFMEVTDTSGIGTPSILKLKFGVAFLDVDGDGRLDLYVGNGHVFDNVAEFDDTATYEQTDQLYLNRGEGRFADVSGSAGPAFRTAGVTRGVAVGDYDSDGTPDVLVNRSGMAARLLRTEWLKPQPWIGFVLRGTRVNRSAIGARVELRTPAGLQVREVRSGSSYLSQSDLRPLFGLDAATRPDEVRVTVRWPGGAAERVRLDKLNRYVTVVEGSDEGVGR
jgi:hypothetical protein